MGDASDCAVVTSNQEDGNNYLNIRKLFQITRREPEKNDRSRTSYFRFQEIENYSQKSSGKSTRRELESDLAAIPG